MKIFYFWLQPFLGLSLHKTNLHKTNLHSAFCIMCIVFSKGLRKAFFFVDRGTSQTKNVVFTSMHTPSRLAHKIPITKPFSSLRLVLPFHTRVLLISLLTAVSLFSHPPTHYSKYFCIFWCIESDSLTRSPAVSSLHCCFCPRFFPCWGFPVADPSAWTAGEHLLFLAPTIPRTVATQDQPTFGILCHVCSFLKGLTKNRFVNGELMRGGFHRV